MSEVKRYDVYTDPISVEGVMYESKHGDYVLYSDYTAKEAECKRLEKENNKQKLFNDELESENYRLLQKLKKADELATYISDWWHKGDEKINGEPVYSDLEVLIKAEDYLNNPIIKTNIQEKIDQLTALNKTLLDVLESNLKDIERLNFHAQMNGLPPFELMEKETRLAIQQAKEVIK